MEGGEATSAPSSPSQGSVEGGEMRQFQELIRQYEDQITMLEGEIRALRLQHLEVDDAASVGYGTPSPSTRTRGLRDSVAAMRQGTQERRPHQREESEGWQGIQQQPPITIMMQPPPSTPKIKVFTGLPPTTPQEATFGEWYPSARDALTGGTISDGPAFIRRHLRGPALHQVSGLGTPDAALMLDRLKKLFGQNKAPTEVYMDLCQSRPKAGQKLTDHLLELQYKLAELSHEAHYPPEESRNKLYLAFSKCCTGSLLLELRIRFGTPGKGAPTFDDLFQAVKEAENTHPPPDSRVNRRAEATVFSAQTPPPEKSGIRQAPPPGRRRKRHCYRCGQEGHFYRACPNPLNPKRVAEQDRERRRRDNEWRRHQGLPEVPLN